MENVIVFVGISQEQVDNYMKSKGVDLTKAHNLPINGLKNAKAYRFRFSDDVIVFGEYIIWTEVIEVHEENAPLSITGDKITQI